MHTEAHLFSVPNDCLWYDKLWGPSQQVVTLFLQLHWLRYYEVAAKSQFVDSLLQEKNLNNFIFTKYLVLHVSAQVTLLLNYIADTHKRRMVDLE